MSDIKVQLPDGSVQHVPQGTTPLEIARSISPRLADAALVAKIAPLAPTPPKAKNGLCRGPRAGQWRRRSDRSHPAAGARHPAALLTDRDPEALQV